MILDKAKMAHDWAIKYGKVDSNYNRENTVQLAWDYADAMLYALRNIKDILK